MGILGRTPLQEKNYEMVNKVKSMNNYRAYTGKETAIIGYEFESDGCYRKYYLEPKPDNIARFIRATPNDKLICNMDDYAIACTMGDYLDIGVEEFVTVIVPYLRKRQGEAKRVMFLEL